MAKRKLNPTEVKICNSSIKRIGEEIEDLRYLLESARLTHDKGLDYSYKKQKAEYANTITQIENDLKIKQNTIDILKDQIKNGVEVIPQTNADNKDSKQETERRE